MFYYWHGWVLLPLHHPHTVTSAPPWLIFVTVTVSSDRIGIKLYQNSLYCGSKGTHFCSWGPISRLSYICSTFARKWQNIALSYPLFSSVRRVKQAPWCFRNDSVSICRHQHTPGHLCHSRAQHSPYWSQRIQCPPASKQRAAHFWAHLHQWYSSIPRWADGGLHKRNMRCTNVASTVTTPLLWSRYVGSAASIVIYECLIIPVSGSIRKRTSPTCHGATSTCQSWHAELYPCWDGLKVDKSPILLHTLIRSDLNWSV